MIRRRRRVGEKARRRIRAGGPTSTHRKALPCAEYRKLVEACLAREGHRCWWCDTWRGKLDPHHVVKRSLGGEDSADNLVILCRACHDRTDAPYSRGKLVIRALGWGRFCGALVTANGKLDGQAKAAELLRVAEAALSA